MIELIKSNRSLFPNIKEVYMFGSRARGDNGPDADLDIALLYKADVTEEFDTECVADCDYWRSLLRVIIPPSIALDVNPLDADNPDKFPIIRKGVDEYSIPVYRL